MQRISGRFAAIVAALAVLPLACSTTTFENTWRAPEARPLQLPGKKVAAVFVSTDAALRRSAEDAMAAEITARGAQGVPSYTLVADADVRDEAQARSKFQSAGVSGAVVMRVVGQQTQYTYEPGAFWGGPHYHSFWGGYWGWGWGSVWAPGYLRADQIVRVETLVYSFDQDMLVWAGVSRTMDPSQVQGLVGDLAKAVTDRMVKDGLLAKA
jgi:hypothetical protein